MKTLNTSRATFVEMLRLAFLGAVVVYFLVMCAKKASGQEVPQVPVFKCEGYGRMLECKIGKAFQDRATMWSIAKTEGEKPEKNNAPYMAAGGNLTYQIHTNDSYTVELHFIDWKDEQIYRQAVKWGRDPKDRVWKVLFLAPRESEALKISPSTTKQAAKGK